MKTSVTHDYTSPVWGHRVEVIKIIDGGKQLRVAGFGQGISVNDFLILENAGGTTRYLVQAIEYKRDPPDMWFADLTFTPRTTPMIDVTGIDVGQAKET